MNNLIFILLSILFGLFSGIIGGMGMGGGTLLIPLLTIFLNYNQKLSQGINLLSFLFMSIIAIYIHYKNGFLNFNKLWIVVLSGIIFSFLGATFACFVDEKILRISFGIFLCLLSLVQFVKLILKRNRAS